MTFVRSVTRRVIEDGDASGNLTSETIGFEHMNTIGIQAIWSGGSSLGGTVNLQVSNDGGTTWTEFSSTITIATDDGNDIITPTGGVVPYKECRIVFVNTAGSGTLNVYVTAKGSAT